MSRSLHMTRISCITSQSLDDLRTHPSRQFYGALDSAHPTPLHYEDFELPLKKGAVRLGVLLPPPPLCEAASQAAAAVRAILPQGQLLHCDTRHPALRLGGCNARSWVGCTAPVAEHGCKVCTCVLPVPSSFDGALIHHQGASRMRQQRTACTSRCS